MYFLSLQGLHSDLLDHKNEQFSSLIIVRSRQISLQLTSAKLGNPQQNNLEK